MTVTSTRRIARVRPLASVSSEEHFFVASDASEFGSEAGKAWTVANTPFPGAPANAGGVPRSGWEIGDTVEQASFAFLAPSVPANVLGMAHNTGRAGRDLPPQAFHKAAASVVGPGDATELLPGVGHVDPEAELTIIVGSRAKSKDTFIPAGPWIVTDLDDRNLEIGINHNCTELKSASSADLGWGVEEILVYLASFMTLHPGDLVLTGFPAECAQIVPGETVVCHVEGIGQLSNPVAIA
jgi:hypothetical protein